MKRVEFSHDGTQAVCASDDSRVNLWDVASGRLVRKFQGRQFALVEGLSEKHKRDCHIIMTSGDALQVSGVKTVRLLDVASSRQVCQFAGGKFALVEGLSGEHKKNRHIITALSDKLRIYEVGNEEQHAEDGAAAALVACFKAPQSIYSVRCVGATICVGCYGGAVCILSAPFLAA